VGLWIIKSYAVKSSGCEDKELKVTELPDGVPHTLSDLWHNAAQCRAFQSSFANNSFDARRRGAIEPGRRGNVRVFYHTPFIRQTNVGVSIANVEQQKHGAME
jgi:hypothetical protein